jgi:hypothetical protein
MGKIFILGAGASISHSNGSLPSISDFFSKAQELDILGNFIDRNRYLLEYIKQYFNFNSRFWFEKIDIEQLMTYLEIDLLKKSNKNDPILMCDIKELLRTVIIKLSENICFSEEDQKSRDYYKLSKLLKEDDMVFTYNWDLLFDNILSNDKSTEYSIPNIYHNFIKLFPSIVPSPLYPSAGTLIRYIYEGMPKTSSLYLKLHGSIDWFQCPNRDCRDFGVLHIAKNPAASFYCEKCNEKLENVLIPPLLNKNYSLYPSIRKIWNLAFAHIKDVSELVIWGYSFPPTDFYSKWLLKNATKVRTVSIINPDLISNKGGKTIRNLQFISKAKDCFNMPIKYKYYEFFKDYLTDNDISTKYNISMPKDGTYTEYYSDQFRKQMSKRKATEL